MPKKSKNSPKTKNIPRVIENLLAVVLFTLLLITLAVVVVKRQSSSEAEIQDKPVVETRTTQ